MSDDELETGAIGADPVRVFRTGDEELAVVVKSILDGEGIPYLEYSAGSQELFGAGGAGGSFNFTVGSVDFLVSREDAERARDVLGALRMGFLGGGEDSDLGE